MVKKIKPELHSKTHFKAATSILMKDTKNMNLYDGSANEIMKSAITARKEKKLRDHELRGSMRNVSTDSAQKLYNSTEEDENAMKKANNTDPTIDLNQFDPIIRSVLRSSNVYRYKGATHLKDEIQLHLAIEEMHSDANLIVKK